MSTCVLGIENIVKDRDLKDEGGPEKVLEYLRVYALALAELDQAGVVGARMIRRLGRAQADAQHRLGSGGMK